MTTDVIRKKLSDYLKVADDKKVKAIYALVADEIEQSALDFPDGLKNELDKRFADYKKGNKMVSAASSQKQINKILLAK
jgi:DNA-binding protein Fis